MLERNLLQSSSQSDLCLLSVILKDRECAYGDAGRS